MQRNIYIDRVYGARRALTVYRSGRETDAFYTDNSEVGVGLDSDAASDVYHTYRLGVKFRDDVSPVEIVQPMAATQIICRLELSFSDALYCPIGVYVQSGAIPDEAMMRYVSYIGGPMVAELPAQATELSLLISPTNAQNLCSGYMVLSPEEEAQDMESLISGTSSVFGRIVSTITNPAARGKVSDITPGEQSVIVGSSDVTVTYTYTHDWGDYAQAFLGVIAVNDDNGERVEIYRKEPVSVQSGETGSFVIPADTLSAGVWTLTICAAPADSANYYADGSTFWVTGQSVKYVVKTNPSTSDVTCDGLPVPEVAWTSANQSAYQVRFADYDSGIRVGTETAFIVPLIFEDGIYPVQVRTATAAGEWSAWSEVTNLGIRNVQPEGTVELTATPDGAVVRLEWEERCPVTAPLEDSGGNYILDSGGDTILGTEFVALADRYAVMRDGKLLGTTTGNMWTDRTGGGEYQIYALHGRYYIPSNIVYAVPEPAADMLSTDGGYTWLALKHTPDRKAQSEEIKSDVTYAYFAGREKPIAFTRGERTRIKSFAYIFKRQDRVKAQMLRGLEGSEVMIVTTRGESIHGIIQDMTWGDARHVTVYFAVRETYREGEDVELDI